MSYHSYNRFNGVCFFCEGILTCTVFTNFNSLTGISTASHDLVAAHYAVEANMVVVSVE